KDKLRKIPAIVEEIVKKEEFTRFDRAHFQRLDDSALVFEIVYFVLSPEYDHYMNVQQGINLGIMEKMEEEGIKIAYPTCINCMQS
ncbi:MAG: mechanosensitive ion channel family protein, partial [Candidatus Paceibacterota bacterium]